MSQYDEHDIDHYLRQIYDGDQRVRIRAIEQLGDIGDEQCLTELRKLLKTVSREHQALIIAVGKLKKEWGVR